MGTFLKIKKKLNSTPIITVPNWELPFNIICDASDFTIGVVLG